MDYLALYLLPTSKRFDKVKYEYESQPILVKKETDEKEETKNKKNGEEKKKEKEEKEKENLEEEKKEKKESKKNKWWTMSRFAEVAVYLVLYRSSGN